MPVLVRKVNPTLWQELDIIGGNDVSADTITNCIKTSDNTLSVWEVDSIESVGEGVLAIISNYKKLETIHIIGLPKDELEQQSIDIDPEEGTTPVKSLVNTHQNLAKLTYTKLGVIANCIVNQFRLENLFTYTIEEEIALLWEAIGTNRLELKNLKPEVQKQLNQAKQ